MYYKDELDLFFSKLLYYQHINARLSQVVKDDLEKYSSESSNIFYASALVLSDLTGPTDNDWEINFHSGVSIKTTKEDYKSELEKICSKQQCLFYSQSYEAFERFLKNCLFERTKTNAHFKEFVVSQLPKTQKSMLTRSNFPGGKLLWKIMKCAGNSTYKELSKNNNWGIDFEITWNVLSACRHSITHSESLISDIKFKTSADYRHTLLLFFNVDSTLNDKYQLGLDLKKFNELVKRFSEFAFQMYKVLYIEEGMNPNDL